MYASYTKVYARETKVFTLLNKRRYTSYTKNYKLVKSTEYTLVIEKDIRYFTK